MSDWHDAAWRPRGNVWLVAGAATLAPFMEILDTSIVNVSYSLDGLSYSAGTNLNLTSVDTPFSVAFGPITADVLYVRLNLATASGNPVIDNSNGPRTVTCAFGRA